MKHGTLRAILMLCVVFCGTTLLAQQPGPHFGRQWPGSSTPPHTPTPEEREAARIRIGITTQQQAQIEQVFADSGKQRHAVGDQLRTLYDQYRELYDSYTIDHSREAKLRQAIAQAHGQMLRIQGNTETKLRDILNREQFDRLHVEMQKARNDRHRFDAHSPHHDENPSPDHKSEP